MSGDRIPSHSPQPAALLHDGPVVQLSLVRLHQQVRAGLEAVAECGVS